MHPCRGRRQERAGPLAQLLPFLLFPFPNTLSSRLRIILDSWIPIRFQGNGKYYFLHFLLAKKLMLSVSHCSAHHPVWTWLRAGMKVCIQLCPLSFERLCHCKEIPFQRLFPLTWNTAGKLSAVPKWESLNVFQELLKRKSQGEKKKVLNILMKHSDGCRHGGMKISRKKQVLGNCSPPVTMVLPQPVSNIYTLQLNHYTNGPW